MSCVLRAGGADFDSAAFLADSPLKADGDAKPGSLSITLDSGSEGLHEQLRLAVGFLDVYEDELRRLGRFPGVEQVGIEFGIDWDGQAARTTSFPPELLWRAGALDIGLDVTHRFASPPA